jgi:hypothetical protein
MRCQAGINLSNHVISVACAVVTICLYVSMLFAVESFVALLSGTALRFDVTVATPKTVVLRQHAKKQAPASGGHLLQTVAFYDALREPSRNIARGAKTGIGPSPLHVGATLFGHKSTACCHTTLSHLRYSFTRNSFTIFTRNSSASKAFTYNSPKWITSTHLSPRQTHHTQLAHTLRTSAAQNFSHT